MTDQGDVAVDIDLVFREQGADEIARRAQSAAERAGVSFSRLASAQASVDARMRRIASSSDRVATGLTKAGREALDLAQAFQQAFLGQEAIVQGLRNLQSEISKSRTLQRQAIIDQRLTADRARQAEIESARAANARLNIEAQRAAQSQLIAQRQAGQQRLQITRAVFENLGRFERAFGATIAGTARTATGAVGRAFEALTSSIRNTNRSFTEGTSTALTRREQLLRSSFSRQERLLSETATRQERTIRNLNQRLSSGVTGAVTGRGLGAGVAGVGGGLGVAGLLTSGFQRFSDLERINKQFLALTQSAEDTALLLGQVREFAKTTPFDLVGVADLAKGFLAIGTATEDVIPRVTAIADAVALTGGGVDELNRIQRAIGQVVSAGRLQGDELNQLAENLPGLNIRQILADQLTGGNVRQLVEMQEAGEITSDLFVTGLITGLQEDERLVGASQDLAETLGGRVANLKESFADFGASLIGSIAEPLKVAVTTAQTTLQGLSDFVKGEVGPALLLLREALKGAALGLGSVIAVKGAAEVIRLVGTAARFALTPFGALLIAAAGVGAALNVMLQRSPALRDAFDRLRERAGQIASVLADRLAPVLGAVGDFIANTILPGLDRFANFLAENLFNALASVSNFISGTVFPVLQRFGAFLASTVLPVLVDVGQTLATAFSRASETVVGFVQRSLPLLQNLATQAAETGQAILDAVGGNRLLIAAGAGLAGFAAAGPVGGLLASVASLADKIVPALKPVGDRILTFFRELFTQDNLIEVGKGALQIVETIGFALGNLVSDPRFVTALAGVVAAAALAAVRFAEGFARGVAENLPELLSLSIGAVKKAVSTVIGEVLFDPKILAGIAAAALVAPSILRAFRSVGEDGARSFGDGFRSRLAASGGFLQGLFGGAEGVTRDANRKALTALFNDAAAEANKLQGTLTAFGSGTRIAALDGIIPSTERIEAARAEVARLTDGLTDAQIRGVQFRSALGQAFSTVTTGAAGVVGGLREIGGAFTGPLSRGLSNASAALFEFFSAGTRYQEVFRRQAGPTADAFGQTFRQRLAGGASQIAESFRTSVAGLRQIAAEQGATLGQAVGQQIATGLAVGLAGFVGGQAEGRAGGTGIISALTAGLTGLAVGGPVVGVAAAGLAVVGAAFGKAKKAAEDAKAAVAAYADVIRQDLGDAFDLGIDGALSFSEALSGGAESALYAKLTEDLTGILPLLNEIGVSQQDVVNAFIQGGEAFDELQRKVGGGVVGQRSTRGFFGVDLNPFNAPDVENVFRNQAAVDELTAAYEALAGAIERVNAEQEFTGQIGGGQIFSRVSQLAAGVQLAIRAAVDEAGAFNDAIADPIEPQFADDVQRELDQAKIKADAVSDAIDRIFGQRDPQTLAASFDAAVLAVAGRFDGLVTGGNIIDQATLDTALNDLKTELSSVAKAGLNEGTVYNEQTLRQATLGVLGAALDGVEDPALRDAIAAAYEEGIANAVPIVDTQNIFDQINAGLDESQLSIPVEIDPSALRGAAGNLATEASTLGRRTADSYTAGLEAGLRARAAAVARAAAAVAAGVKNAVDDWLGIASPSRVAMQQGAFYGEGFAVGILGQRAAAAQAAQQLSFAARAGLTQGGAGASTALTNARDAGRQIGEAIADGLADTEADISNVISEAVQAALDNMSSLGSPVRDATAAAAAQLFAGFTGADNLFEDRSGPQVFGLQAGITSSLQGFLGTFDSNVSRIFEVNAKKLSELNAQDREVFGTDVFSLDTKTVFGASNFEAIVGYFEQVAELGESLIARGAPLEEVSKTLQEYIDDLITTAVNLGFNREQLEGLVNGLGLSDEALAAFIDQVKALNQTAALPGRPPARDDEESRETQRLPRIQQTFVVQLPTGDPQANALAVANRQASIYALPGG